LAIAHIVAGQRHGILLGGAVQHHRHRGDADIAVKHILQKRVEFDNFNFDIQPDGARSLWMTCAWVLYCSGDFHHAPDHGDGDAGFDQKFLGLSGS
jgi:hypothetical protein